MIDNKLRTNGTFVPMDKDGYFLNNLDLKLIDPLWLLPVHELVECYCNLLKDNIISIYLRGSIPKNEAIQFKSDIDIMVICNNYPSKDTIIALRSIQNNCLKKYVYVKKVDTLLLTYNTFEKSYLAHFYIKVMSLLLYGLNLHVKINPIKPSFRIISQIPIVLSNIQFCIKVIDSSDDNLHISNSCNWAFSSIIRSLFEFLIQEEKKYTRDLYLCYKVSTKHFPEMTKKIETALILSIDTINDKRYAKELLIHFHDWLTLHIELFIKNKSK